MNRGGLYLATVRQMVRMADMPSWPGPAPGHWLCLSEDSSRRLELQTGLLASLPRLSLGGRLDAIAWRLRQPYLEWIGRLSRVNAHDETWWGTELAGRNIYSYFFPRLCLLAVARQLLDEGLPDPCLVVCASPGLLQGVAELARSRGVAARGLIPGTMPASDGLWLRLKTRLRSWLASSAAPAVPAPPRGDPPPAEVMSFSPQAFAGPDTALLFTWMDRRSLGPDGRLQDPYFGVLPAELAKRGLRLAWVPTLLPGLTPAEAAGALDPAAQTVFLPEAALTAEDLIACHARAHAYQPRIPADDGVDGLPLLSLAQENLTLKGGLINALTMEPLVRGLARAGVRPARVIHVMEGQPWESLLALAVRRHWPSARIAGYDNLTLSRLKNSMYPAPSEFGLRPLPDRLVSNGPICSRVFKEEGWPPETVATGCAIRHAYLWQERTAPPAQGESDGPLRVLLASPIGLGESMEMMHIAALAMAKSRDFMVRVKLHPALDQARVLGQLRTWPGGSRLEMVNAPIPELLDWAEVVLYNGTSVGLEALGRGVPPVLLRLEGFPNIDNLEAVESLRWEASDPDQLLEALKSLRDLPRPERELWRKRAKGALRGLLAPVTPTGIGAFLS
ncbi:hypothetical protein AAU61_01110 [Desulfocarbo indianensis]|nr:hypothetical protein AAU61_01110 [Desulfocarbo indianensis]